MAGRHGASRTRTYRAWSEMIRRCTKPDRITSATYYGMEVCDAWQRFEGFLADLGHCPPGQTLDRIDNEMGYVQGNCRWATVTEQNRNRRNVKLCFVGACVMRHLRRRGVSLDVLARTFSVSVATASRTCARRIWNEWPTVAEQG